MPATSIPRFRISCPTASSRFLGPVSLAALMLACATGAFSAVVSNTSSSCFGIQVVDDQTGRGVPLVELETVNHLKWVTDSAGWVAFSEPGLMNESIFFHVRSHGYEYPKDGFGYAGLTLTPVPGESATVRIQRINIAERLYRVTGEGIYRDSVLLNLPTPLDEPLGSGKVAGQDSAFALLYRGKIHWFWGDTARMRYPLGHFWMAGAVSDLPTDGGLPPEEGVNLRYFTDREGFSRPVSRLGVERGMIWADGFLTVADETGVERLVCRYAHMESLSKMVGHGFALFNDERGEFERVKELDLADRHLFPAQAHVIRYRDGGVDYFLAGSVFPNVRVQARLDHVLDPARYEVWTCLATGSSVESPVLLRDPDGRLRFQWKRGGAPLQAADFLRLVQAGEIQLEEAPFLPIDIESGEPILMHRGSVRWNAHRQLWILIAGQQGGSSYLGEIWYAEAPEPTGPWRNTRKIITHDRYDFYNPVHHPFFDQFDGRLIYLEGTYVNTFSGHPTPTPRYNYNQVMYRLDLDDPRLLELRQPNPGSAALPAPKYHPTLQKTLVDPR
jgi:hypothetical protein